MLRGKYDEAEKLLTQANDKTPNDADTLINLATVARLSGKGSEVRPHPSQYHERCSQVLLQVAERYINQLRDVKPDHPFLRALATKEDEFERHALQYSR